MEDLDRATSSPAHESRQLADLAALGIDWDGPVVRQSERFELYRAAIERCATRGWCTRATARVGEIRVEIEEAPRAPHVHRPDGAYPGTCRELTDTERAARERAGRRPALRLRTNGEVIELVDGIAGAFRGRGRRRRAAPRADGVPAYNLAVVVDDAAQGVTQVVRGDDLLSSTPRQVHLQRLLGLPQPEYLHVPLVLGDGRAAAREAPRGGDARRPRRGGLERGGGARRARPCRSGSHIPANRSRSISSSIASIRGRVPRAAVHLADLQRSTGVNASRRSGDAAHVRTARSMRRTASAMEEVASDIFQLPFWTPAFCAAVVRAAELVGFEPDPDDPVPGHEVSLATISPVLFAAVQDDVGLRIWPQLQAVWPLIEYRGLRDAFVIRYRARRAGVAAAASGHRAGLGDGQAQRRLRRRRARLPPPGVRQRRSNRSARCWPGRRS